MISPGVVIRPYQLGDLAFLRDIEIKSYPEPWLKDEFTGFGRSTFVGADDKRTVGYYCIRYSSNGVRLLRFAVAKAWRRMGCGSCLMDHVKKNGGKVTTIVSELNDGGVAFLHDTGFRCVNVMKNAFKENGELWDGFYFLWRALNG